MQDVPLRSVKAPLRPAQRAQACGPHNNGQHLPRRRSPINFLQLWRFRHVRSAGHLTQVQSSLSRLLEDAFQSRSHVATCYVHFLTPVLAGLMQ